MLIDKDGHLLENNDTEADPNFSSFSWTDVLKLQ